MRNALTLIALLNFCLVSAQHADSLLARPNWKSNPAFLGETPWQFSTEYQPTDSYWALQFTEDAVFRAQLSYEHPTDAAKSYQIRIGRGGQLYSFRSGFGESVPPQWRSSSYPVSYGGGSSYAPWVDEVWQMVCVDGSKNRLPDSAYFIHQSGVYLRTPSQVQPFYSPIVAEYYSAHEQSYTIVNWGQQAHTDDLENSHYSSALLYYTRYRNMGEGIIQIDNLVYNFGTDSIDFLNAPWGGVRNSSLSHFFIATPNQELQEATGLYGQTPVMKTRETGGWVAWSNTHEAQSQTLAMAHSLGTQTRNNYFRYGDAGDLSNPYNLRDYKVFEMIRFPKVGQLTFGKALAFRYFYIVGANADSVRGRVVAQQLVASSFDSAWVCPKNQTDSLAYTFWNQQTQISPVQHNSTALVLHCQPFENSLPLFRIQATNGQIAYSSNPYHFSPRAYDGITQSVQLLGFRSQACILTLQYDSVCEGSNYQFPDQSMLQNVQNSTVQLSYFRAAAPNTDSIVITHLYLHPFDTQIHQQGNTLLSATSNYEYQWLNCNKSFAPVPNETEAQFLVRTNGSYALDLRTAHCRDTTQCISIHTAATELTPAEIKIFPNPNHGTFSIRLDKTYLHLRLRIYSPQAQQIGTTSHYYNCHQLQYRLSAPPGTYWLVLETDAQTRISLPLIIE